MLSALQERAAAPLFEIPVPGWLDRSGYERLIAEVGKGTLARGKAQRYYDVDYDDLGQVEGRRRRRGSPGWMRSASLPLYARGTPIRSATASSATTPNGFKRSRSSLCSTSTECWHLRSRRRLPHPYSACASQRTRTNRLASRPHQLALHDRGSRPSRTLPNRIDGLHGICTAPARSGFFDEPSKPRARAARSSTRSAGTGGSKGRRSLDRRRSRALVYFVLSHEIGCFQNVVRPC